MRHNKLSEIIGRDHRPLHLMVVAASVIAFSIVVWECMVWLKILPFHILSHPTAIATRLWHLITEGELVGTELVYFHEHMLVTVLIAVPGAFLGSILGFFGIVWIPLFPRFRYLAALMVGVFYGTAATAVFLIFHEWFGYGLISKALGSVWSGFGVQTVITYWAIHEILYPKNYERGKLSILDRIERAGIGRWRLVWDHLIPMLIPSYVIALMIGIVISWKLPVFTERFGSVRGIGQLMAIGQQEVDDITLVVIGILALLVGVLLSWAIVRLVLRPVLRRVFG